MEVMSKVNDHSNTTKTSDKPLPHDHHLVEGPDTRSLNLMRPPAPQREAKAKPLDRSIEVEEQVQHWPKSWNNMLRRSIECGCPVVTVEPDAVSASIKGSSATVIDKGKPAHDGAGAPTNSNATKPSLQAASISTKEAAKVASFGLRVCGVDFADLLDEQLATEAAMSRVIDAYKLIDSCRAMLPATTLALLLKIKSPPQMLSRVIEASLVVLDEWPSSKRLAPTEIMSFSERVLMDGEEMYARMTSLDIDAITDEQLNRLAHYLTEINHDLVHKAFGVASFLWSWVCAICVICGSPFAALPSEKKTRTKEAASAPSPAAAQMSLSAPLSRSCNGAPITGRPSYVSNVEQTDDGSLMKNSWNAGAAGATEPSAARLRSSLRSSLRRSLRRSRLSLEALTPLKFLGAGAFANVFMCRHEASGQIMALKCILKSVVLKKKKQQQVRSERDALSCSPHPNVIRLYASFADEQHLYFALELALGGELFALIEEMGTLPEAAVRYYAASVTLGLTHLHEHGFIYRDLKPENVLIDREGRLKLCDLGLAKKAKRTYTCVGTPQYMSPELLRGDGATAASDFWALGVLIFEMTTGDLPFDSPDGSDQALYVQIRRGHYSWPSMSAAATPRRRPSPQPVSVALRDLVCGLLRQSVPLPQDDTRRDKAASDKAKPSLNMIASPRQPSIGRLRIGSGPGGDAEVCAHVFFKKLDLAALVSGQITAPYMPILRGSDDDGNFGPLHWRGEPVLNSPEYDASSWDAQWNVDGAEW